MWKCENMKLRKCVEWGNAKMRGAFFAAVAFSALLAFTDTLDLRSGDSVCKVDAEHGARITSWKVRGEELLWMQSVPQKNDGKWRHGGIPIVWPWQGDEYPDGVTNGPLHGVAWRSPFKVESRRKVQGGEAIDLSLEACGLRADYSIALRKGHLYFLFKTTNVGTVPQKFALSIHPYFNLPERNWAEVEGLDGLPYRDTRNGHSTNGVWKGVMPITYWTDHVFFLAGKPLCAEIRDVQVKRNKWVSWFVQPSNRRLTPRICVFSRDAEACWVWNPGELWAAEGAALYGELPDDAWRHILSIEPSTVEMKDAKPLLPGESRVLTAEISRVGSL